MKLFALCNKILQSDVVVDFIERTALDSFEMCAMEMRFDEVGKLLLLLKNN